MVEYIRDVEIGDFYPSAITYVESAVISVFKDFFGFYPQVSRYQWIGTPLGEEILSDTKLRIVNYYPQDVEGLKKPTLVIRISGTQEPLGMGAISETVNGQAVFGPANFGMATHMGYLFKGNIELSVVSFNRLDTKNIASLILGFLPYVLYRKLGIHNINVHRYVDSYEYTEEKYLAGQNLFMANILIPFLTQGSVQVPQQYEHYLIIKDINEDGNEESYLISDNEIPANMRNSIRVFNTTTLWTPVVDNSILDKVIEEFNIRKENGTLDLMTTTYLLNSRTLDCQIEASTAANSVHTSGVLG